MSDEKREWKKWHKDWSDHESAWRLLLSSLSLFFILHSYFWQVSILFPFLLPTLSEWKWGPSPLYFPTSVHQRKPCLRFEGNLSVDIERWTFWMCVVFTRLGYEPFWCIYWSPWCCNRIIYTCDWCTREEQGMREEEIFMTHLPGTQHSLLTLLMRDIESVFSSTGPKLDIKQCFQSWVTLTSGL